MAFIVEQKVGRYTYVWEAESFWDKERKQPRQKRKFLGRKDLVTGKIIDTKNKSKSIPVRSYDFGNTYFLQQIATQIGIKELLDGILDKSEDILTLVYYKISEGSAPYYLAQKWAEFSYILSEAKDITSQRISELLERIGGDTNIKVEFFREWIRRQGDISAIYFDITSISTYSRLLDLAEWGYNRCGERLRQINLGLVYGERSELPLYYNIYQGSITDVVTLENIIKLNHLFGIEDVIYVLDRGFYSEKNIKGLKGKEVIIPIPFSTGLSKTMLERHDKGLMDRDNMFMFNDSIYYYLREDIELFGEGFKVHIYRDKQRHNEDETMFFKTLLAIEDKINRGNYLSKEDVIEEIEKVWRGYGKYYEIILKQGKYFIIRNSEKIEEQVRRFGTYILVTNINDISRERILELYKMKERIEKIFDFMKNDLDKERVRMNKRERVEGDIFIIFLALILSSYIENVIKRSKKLKNYTKKELIYELKKLKLTEFGNGLNILNEQPKKVKDIYEEFKINISNIQT